MNKELANHQVSKNFKLHEFLPKECFTDTAKLEDLLKLINPKIIQITQFLRETFGPLKINDWMDGGQYNYSGLRTKNSPDYKPKSQHTFGRAVDIKRIVPKHDSVEMLNGIRTHYDKISKISHIRVENPFYTKTWLHIDVAPNTKSLTIVNP